MASSVCVYFLNPTLDDGEKYIREGRCMQKASSWATAWPPVTLATLAAIAKKKRVEVRLVDGNVEPMNLTGLIEDIRIYTPALIVINTGFPSIDSDMEIAQRVREAFPRTKILGFGVYFTLLEKEALVNYPVLDFGIVGEPEGTFEELLNALLKGDRVFSGIKGLVYRNPQGVQWTASRPFICDLDELPFPDRSLLKNDRYCLPHNDRIYSLVNVARGCPYPCTYCIVNPYYGRMVRKHSVDYVMAEIRECVGKYGIQELLFWEEVFTLDRNFAIKLCEAIRQNFPSLQWAATTRVGLLDEELLATMKSAGCSLLGLGIESGSQTILDLAKKKQTVAEIRRAVELCKKAGIRTMGHFIFGLPGETRQTAEETIRFMLDLGLDFMQSYCAVPYPKTEFGELAKKEGWIRAQKWSEYDFGGNSIVESGTIKARDVTRMRLKAFRKFYFRPSFVVGNLLKEIKLSRFFRLSKFVDWMKPGRRQIKIHGR